MNQFSKQLSSVLPGSGETVITLPSEECKISAAGKYAVDSTDSLFEHFAWLYILFREKIFRDDTERMIRALWPDRNPRASTRLIEFGCGPGFYSCQFAAHFPQISVVGVDNSESQLAWARTKKRALGLANCSFERNNVLSVSCVAESYDALVASRLFTVLPQREEAIAEMFRILRPGGRCFVAEPRRAFRASIPLFSMWMLATITRFKNGYREPSKATVLSTEKFEGLFRTQPWRQINIWQDERYQYVLCEKG